MDDETKDVFKVNSAKAVSSPADAVFAFNAVFEHLKTASTDSELTILPEHKKKVKLLLKTCMKLIKKINKLEETEVDWDDDEDSAYIQEDR